MTEEIVVYEGKKSLWSLFHLIVAGALTLPVMGIGLGFWLSAFLTYISTELAVTNKRVIAKTGFIRRETIEINLIKVESIQVNQGIFGRIFNFGSLKINGTGSSSAPITGICNPLVFRREFMKSQDKYNRH
jgi:uncharacterized membrane protein YdbT with pleckstrin-like domain